VVVEHAISSDRLAVAVLAGGQECEQIITTDALPDSHRVLMASASHRSQIPLVGDSTQR
jgi:hypothetical protein